jgi:hypothetical protein
MGSLSSGFSGMVCFLGMKMEGPVLVSYVGVFFLFGL